MTSFQREIKQFILKALLRAQDQPMTDDSIRQIVRSGFAHVAMTETELTHLIREVEASGIITGTNDDVFGLMWTLTVKGKLSAGQLK